MKNLFEQQKRIAVATTIEAVICTVNPDFLKNEFRFYYWVCSKFNETLFSIEMESKYAFVC